MHESYNGQPYTAILAMLFPLKPNKLPMDENDTCLLNNSCTTVLH